MGFNIPQLPRHFCPASWILNLIKRLAAPVQKNTTVHYKSSMQSTLWLLHTWNSSVIMGLLWSFRREKPHTFNFGEMNSFPSKSLFEIEIQSFVKMLHILPEIHLHSNSTLQNANPLEFMLCLSRWFSGIQSITFVEHQLWEEIPTKMLFQVQCKFSFEQLHFLVRSKNTYYIASYLNPRMFN